MNTINLDAKVSDLTVGELLEILEHHYQQVKEIKFWTVPDTLPPSRPLPTLSEHLENALKAE